MDLSPRAWVVMKWMGFVASIWVQSISGNNYTFANYSADLKRVMNYSQLELNGLGVAKDVGKSVGLLAGFLSDFLPPQVILLIGASVGVLGYGCTWLVVSERVGPPAFWQMCIVVFMGGNSSTWMNTAVLVTCMRNFSRSRGTVSGILKGFVGLSTAIFTVLCSSLFTGDSSAFLLLLTLLPAAICLVAAGFLREVPSSTGAASDPQELTNFSILNVISLALSFYLLAYTFIGGSFNHIASQLFAAGLLVFVLSPVAVPIRLLSLNWLADSSDKEKEKIKEPLLGHNSNGGHTTERQVEDSTLSSPEENPVLPTTLAAATVGTEDLYVPPVLYKRPQLGDNFTLLEILVTVDFWILFLTFLAAIGTGMAVINNMGQIGEALGHPDVAMFVSFISIFGFFGRIGAGAISEHFVRSMALPRPVWMAGSKVVMILGYLALAWGVQGSLQLGSIIVGVCYGVHMTIVVATSSEMFGLKSFGITYNILVLNIPLGSFIFSGLLAGYLYDKEAEKGLGYRFLSRYGSPVSDEATKCLGAHCYRTLFIIMSFVLAVGLILDLVLIVRLRPVFQKLYGKGQTSDSGESRHQPQA